MKPELIAEGLKGAPAVGGTAWYYLSMNEWIGLATGIYIVIQGAYLLRKWWREEQEHALKMKEKALEQG